jgi:hypothetical protein
MTARGKRAAMQIQLNRDDALIERLAKHIDAPNEKGNRLSDSFAAAPFRAG